ncbi:Vacuolar protease A [Podochytrium sp. JEL0797]|nr:Vacuolar protease A [Podochytrium sp. JEL0797]
MEYRILTVLLFSILAHAQTTDSSMFHIPLVTTPQSMAQTNQMLSDRVASNTFTNKFLNFFSAASVNTSDVGLMEFKHVMTEFRAQVQVGTPARTFNLLLDTGSFDMWIFGANCPSKACLTANNKYDLTQSSSGVDLMTTALGGQYADGSGYGGDRVTDDVTIGQASLAGFQFTQVTKYVSQGGAASNPSDNDSDGIVGMGFAPQTNNAKVTPSFIQQVISSKVLGRNLLSYAIDVSERKGTVTLGGYNTELFQNSSMQPSWVPMLTDSTLTTGKLALPLARVWIDGLKLEEFTSHASSTAAGGPEGTTGSAIIDTGTSQAIVSYVLVDAIGARVEGARKVYLNGGGSGAYTYVMPCARKAEDGGPVVTLEFAGGVTTSITALEYVSAPVGGQCQLVLQGSNGGFKQGTYLVGNTFLKRFVTVFDYDQMRIGFALGAGRSTNASVSYDASVGGFSQGGGSGNRGTGVDLFGVPISMENLIFGGLFVGILVFVLVMSCCLRRCVAGKLSKRRIDPGMQPTVGYHTYKDFA